MSRSHQTDYDPTTTERCERALLTLLGDFGPRRERIYLAGGLAPRYLVGSVPPPGARVDTTDVVLIIGLALGDENPETHRTLYNNLNVATPTRRTKWNLPKLNGCCPAVSALNVYSVRSLFCGRKLLAVGYPL